MMEDVQESEFVGHVPCTNCGSSDANSLYSDGHTYCFACESYTHGNETEAVKTSSKAPKECWTMKDNDGDYIALSKRFISAKTCKKYQYWCGTHEGKPVQVANYFDDKGTLKGQKVRMPNKEFKIVGKVGADDLFGKQLWSKGRKIVITEGEIDCLTIADIQDCRYPVVSLPTGAKAAKKTCSKNLEYLSNFEEIILMFDMDEAGREAAEECAKVLPAGKVKIAILPYKDANECLLKGDIKAITNAIFEAKPYVPDGVISAKDIKERVNKFRHQVESMGIPFAATDQLNLETKGNRFGDLLLVTAGSGVGKSTFVRQNIHQWVTQQNLPCGVAFLEEAVEETVQDILGLDVRKRIRQNPDSITDEEFDEAYDKLFNTNKLFLYDNFAENNAERLMGKLAYMVDGLGCKVIVIDHISIIVSGSDADSDERKMIDHLMTEFKSFAKRKNILMVVICHLKNPQDGKTHEEGLPVKITDLRGSGSLRQLSDTIVALERNQQSDSANQVVVRLLKCRFTGATGKKGYMYYNHETGWLEESSIPDETPWDESTGGDY